MRRPSRFLLASALSLGLAAGVLVGLPGSGAQVAPDAAPARARAERPNVVVVMADDMRVDDLAWAPHVRRLARKGVTFENSFSPYPLCCPARASFLTGQLAHNHGVLWHEPPFGYGSFDDSATLATAMRRAGYRTGYLGKYLNRYGLDDSKVTGDPSYRYVPNGWDDWRGAVENPGGAGFHGGTYHYDDIAFNVNGHVDDSHRGDYGTEVIGAISRQMAGRFHDARERKGDPFFLFVNYVAPHAGGPRDPDDPRGWKDAKGHYQSLPTPYVAPRYRGRFDDIIDRPQGIAEQGDPSERNVSDKPKRIRQLPPMSAQNIKAMTEAGRQRAESVWAMDKQVATLVRTLKQDGEWDRTVLMFTSDNGFLQGEHRLRTGKIWSYEPSLRVPLVVTGPGIRGKGSAGRLRYDPVTTVDLTATILDLGGAKAPHVADGHSVQTTLREGDQGWTVPVVTEATHTSPGKDARFGKRSSIGLRTPRYAMSRYRNGDAELYDLKRDPEQQRSVWGERKYRGVQRDLADLWDQMHSCAGEECQRPLPASLRATPTQERSWTRTYWASIEKTYGYR